MDIILLRTFLTNIGNGFIDKGARETVESAFPKANIIETSGYPLFAGFNNSKSSFDPLARSLNIIGQGNQLPTNRNRQHLHLSEYVDADLAVFPGCTLYPDLLEFFAPVLQSLDDRGIPIVFLGAGGYFYDPGLAETQLIRDYLNRLNDIALITRDQPCYNAFSDLFDYAVPGIDNAFFIGEWHNPPSANCSYNAHTFDKQEEPDIQTENEILRGYHTPFGYSMPFSQTLISLKARYNEINANYLDRENLLVSDLLEDYLFLYANAEETHSDRVHACVPALVYGNKAQFYHDTPRAELFAQIVDTNISTRPVSLSSERLEIKKDEQVERLKDAVSELF